MRGFQPLDESSILSVRSTNKTPDPKNWCIIKYLGSLHSCTQQEKVCGRRLRFPIFIKMQGQGQTVILYWKEGQCITTIRE